MRARTLLVEIALCFAWATQAMADPTQQTNVTHSRSVTQESVIAVRVRASISAQHLRTLANVRVETDRSGIVSLTGEVPTQDGADLAAMIARETKGVKTVHSRIVVQQQTTRKR